VLSTVSGTLAAAQTARSCLSVVTQSLNLVRNATSELSTESLDLNVMQTARNADSVVMESSRPSWANPAISVS
jgi:hypothetical protein